MHKLNCRPGDLAVVISAELPENIGLIVEVVGPWRGRRLQLRGQGHVWKVRTAGQRKALTYRWSGGRKERRAEGPVPDHRLRPVSGLPDEAAGNKEDSVRVAAPRAALVGSTGR